MKILRAFLIAITLAYSSLWSQNCYDEKPTDSDFTQKTIVESTDYIMEIAIAKDGKVYYAEKEGAIKVYNPADGKITELINLDVFTLTDWAQLKSAGLNGIGLHPDFLKNGFLYVYYMEPLTIQQYYVKKTTAHLSRFTVKNNSISASSEVKMITIMINNQDHQGGSITFDPEGNLYLATGDDVHCCGYNQYAPNDWSGTANTEQCTKDDGPCGRDGGRSTANTNDLRGKVIRITPQDDGSYTIPEGNLFPQTDSTRGEIYTMGHRIPYRISIDNQRGWLMIGEGGPANGTGGDRGPTGHEEYNIAKKPGFFGWPMFNGPDDRGFRPWNFSKNSPDMSINGGEAWQIDKPVLNLSPRNTGKILMPKPVKPVMAFDKSSSSVTHDYFKGHGGCVPVAGPVYYYGNYDSKGKQLPPYYDGKWIITDTSPGKIGISAVNEAVYIQYCQTPNLFHTIINIANN